MRVATLSKSQLLQKLTYKVLNRLDNSNMPKLTIRANHYRRIIGLKKWLPFKNPPIFFSFRNRNKLGVNFNLWKVTNYNIQKAICEILNNF